jgi:hypothetical protein
MKERTVVLKRNPKPIVLFELDLASIARAMQSHNDDCWFETHL